MCIWGLLYYGIVYHPLRIDDVRRLKERESQLRWSIEHIGQVGIVFKGLFRNSLSARRAFIKMIGTEKGTNVEELKREMELLKEQFKALKESTRDRDGNSRATGNRKKKEIDRDCSVSI